MKTIDEIWAWMAPDSFDGGREKMVCCVVTEGHFSNTMPLVFTERDKAERRRPDAQAFADQQGVVVRLCKFSTRRNLGCVRPKGADRAK